MLYIHTYYSIVTKSWDWKLLELHGAAHTKYKNGSIGMQWSYIFLIIALLHATTIVEHLSYSITRHFFISSFDWLRETTKEGRKKERKRGETNLTTLTNYLSWRRLCMYIYHIYKNFNSSLSLFLFLLPQTLTDHHLSSHTDTHRHTYTHLIFIFPRLRRRRAIVIPTYLSYSQFQENTPTPSFKKTPIVTV